MNELILQRLEGIRRTLVAVDSAGAPLSAASRGREREEFVHTFLREVFPPPYRFGSGDITDRSGERSGQADIVVEYPFLPSVPLFAGSSSRLYLAEGVAAVVEVKSDVSAQWEEVVTSVSALRRIRRSLKGAVVQIGDISEDVPFFAVGYRGWQRPETIREHLQALDIDGVLVIDPGIYVSNQRFSDPVELSGPSALWGFISSLHETMTCIRVMDVDPHEYIK